MIREAISYVFAGLATSIVHTLRFEKALVAANKGLSKGYKKSGRALALKLIHILDGVDDVRRDEILQRLEAENYNKKWIEHYIRKFHVAGIINCSVGAKSKVRIT